MSEISLTDTEKAVLAHGLKFIPTPNSVSKNSILDSHNEFARKIKCSFFFHGKPNRGNNRLFQSRSSWEPNDKLLPPQLLEELDELKVKLGQINVFAESSNLTSEELSALETLRNDETLVFKKADKGNAIVIMDREQYVREALSQLDNEKYYRKIDQPVFPSTFTRVKEILNSLEAQGFLSPKQVKYLTPGEDARPRQFYILPKIHKPMDKWTVPFKCPPGRPIVSDCSSDSYRWSELIDHYLKPLACNHPSYVKDTNDFLDKLRDLEISENALLVTCDVESLYTNIQPDRGLEALDNIYRNSSTSIPYNEIRELLDISLTNNDFKFGEQWYLQTSGTAMGKKYAPNYANIYMANLEQSVLANSPLKPTIYLRYLDDVFLIWQHSEQALHEFIRLFNSQDSSIKITANISAESVDFLDVTVFKGNSFKHHQVLDTKVYFKPTDTHQLLDRKSYHPRHTFDGLIKSQLLRFLRICNNIEDFHEATSILFKALREHRHYSIRRLRKIKSVFLKNYVQIGEHHFPQGAAVKCKKRVCQCCLYIHETSSFGQHDSELEFPIWGKLDCQSKDIIYIIQCKKCNEQYIGETERSLSARLVGHLSDIRHLRNKPVAEHFNGNCWPHEENMTIYPISANRNYISKQQSKARRLKMEAHWIRELDTQEPRGMNRKLPIKRDIVLTLPFNKTALKAIQLFRDSFDNIQKLYPVKYKDNFICAYKRNKNIGDYLVSSRLK